MTALGFIPIWLCLGPAACDVGEYILFRPVTLALCQEMLNDPGHEHVNATGVCVREDDLRASGIIIDDWNALLSLYERYPNRILHR